MADRLGRDAILVDLKLDYADMATARLVGDAPMFVQMEGASENPPEPSAVVDKAASTPRNDGNRWNQNNGRGF